VAVVGAQALACARSLSSTEAEPLPAARKPGFNRFLHLGSRITSALPTNQDLAIRRAGRPELPIK
jgi:hypothetical protein